VPGVTDGAPRPGSPRRTASPRPLTRADGLASGGRRRPVLARPRGHLAKPDSAFAAPDRCPDRKPGKLRVRNLSFTPRTERACGHARETAGRRRGTRCAVTGCPGLGQAGGSRHRAGLG